MNQLTIPCEGSDRFLIELEFVQNLSNPKYLNYLAQNGYLQQSEFITFLKYLTYWKQPEYLKLLLFPQCLAFLDNLINSPTFCRELAIPQFVEYVHAQQGSHWIAKDR
jgi:mediator of RNA polymerase II transcription subunit 31